MNNTGLFIKKTKPSQKYYITKNTPKYLNDHNIGLIINKENVVMGYQVPLESYHSRGDLVKDNDEFKRECGLTPSAFDKRIGDDFFYLYSLEYSPLLYQLPVLKPVKGTRELTNHEKKYFYQIIIASMIGNNTLNPLGDLYDELYPKIFELDNDELISAFFDFSDHNNLLCDEMEWRGAFQIDRELNQPKDMVIKGEKTYQELKNMNRKELNKYYNETDKIGECIGCDVRQINGVGNCLDGGEPYICRKMDKQTSLEEFL